MNIADFFTKVTEITADETKDALENKSQDELTVIDVRQPNEYERGHITGARLIPLSTLSDNVDKLDSKKTIITYCQRGVRSRSAAALLKRMGFKEIYSMKGGIEAWNGNTAAGEYDAGLFLLHDRNTDYELISLAWALEEGARLFYSRSMDIVHDKETKDLLSALVKAEENHKSSLEDALGKIKEKNMTDDMVKDSSLENIMEGGISIDKAVNWVENQSNRLVSILEMSMNLEANSLDLYMKIYDEIGDGEAKTIFKGLIEEEKAHLNRLGNMLDEKFHHK